MLDIYAKPLLVITQFLMFSATDENRVRMRPYVRLKGYLIPGMEQISGSIDNLFAKTILLRASEEGGTRRQGNELG